jgi:P27 family predicted phage terminase small subunit
MRKTSINPPKYLSVAARKWWRALMGEYQIEDAAGLLLLTTAMECFDRMKAAGAVLDEEGLTFTDRYGQARPHPAATVEANNRSQMLGAIKQLTLDLEPLRDRVGRPGGR